MNTCCDVLTESQNAIAFRTFFDYDDGNMLVLMLVPGSLQYNSHFLNVLYVVCL